MMPAAWAQAGEAAGGAPAIAQFLPIKYFIGMIRGVFLKGIGFETLWREAIALGVLGVVLLVIAVFQFRKRSA